MDVKVDSSSYLVEKKQGGFLPTAVKYVTNQLSTSKDSKDYDLLLNKVSLHLNPGSVTAIMGLGHNYKYLLECLSLRQNDGLLGGKILHDGAVRKTAIYKDIAFIKDIGISHFESLTVFDYLYYGARLRVTHGVIECRERARLAARVVGLEGSTKIGRLSKAEVRILSIAAELVGNPTLICLVDPTEGLDAGGALDVIRVLHSVAKRVSMSTTIVYNVFSIHDDMFRLLDNIAFFVDNKLEYFCPVRYYYAAGRGLLTAQNLVAQASAVVLDHERNHSVVKKSNKNEPIMICTNHVNTFMKVIDDLNRLTGGSGDGGSGRGNTNSGEKKVTFSPISPVPPPATSGAVSTETDNFSALHSAVTNHFDYLAFPQNGLGEGGAMNGTPTRTAPHQNTVGRNQRSISDEFYSLSRKLNEAGLPYRYHKTLFQEFKILYQRSLKFHWKNSMYLRMGLFRFMLAGIIIGTLVWNNGGHLDSADLLAYSTALGNDNAYNVTSAMFVVVAMSLVGTAFAVPYLHANAYLLKFEVASGLQTTVASWLSLILIDVPMYIIAAIVIGAIVYNMINLQGSSVNFFGTLFIVTLTGYSLAAVCAIWFKSKTMAMFVFSVLASFCLMFSGYLQFIPQLPGMWVWASDLVFTRYAFESFLIVAFNQSPDKSEYLDIFSFDNTSSSHCNGWIALWFALLQILVLLGLTPPWRQWRLTAEIVDSAEVTPKDAVHAGIVDRFVEELSAPAILSAATVSPTAMEAQQSQQSQAQFYIPEELNPRVTQVRKNMVTTLTFRHLRYTRESLKGGGDDAVETKFRGVFGEVNPGQCCCVVDATNDGSSALLLQVLGGKCRSSGKTTGGISANDQKLGRSQYYLNAAYVQRGDVPNVSTLTVREVLRYAAWLRRTDQHTCATLSRAWAKNISKGEAFETLSAVELIGPTGNVEERVSEVLAMMGLDTVADCVVGEVQKIHVTDNRDSRLKTVLNTIPWFNNRATRTVNGRPVAISPAQLRCLSIGTELINLPGLIFLEDPISDLEWHDAEQVALVIKSLADGGRTVICNMQRPTLRIMSHFSQIMMLGSGVLIYSGPMDASASHLDNIGFERMPGQNDLEYLQDVASNRGKMAVVHGRRGNALSPDDLADLNRSLTNIRRASKSIDESRSTVTKSMPTTPLKDGDIFSGLTVHNSAAGDDGNNNNNNSSYNSPKLSRSIGGKVVENNRDNNSSPFSLADDRLDGSKRSPRSTKSAKLMASPRIIGGVPQSVLAVSGYKHTAPMGPTSWVLTHRGFKQLVADKKFIVIHCLQCLAAGALIGSVYWNMEDGNYQERMSLFAVAYVAVNLFIIDALEGIYMRKEAFIREAFVDASSFLSYYLSDTAPSLCLYAFGAVLFVVPIYVMSGLRGGADHFIYFYLIMLASVYTNYSLAYLLSMTTDSLIVCKMIFSGVIIPLQLLMSGYIVLISTMQDWIEWGSYICPMSYYLAGCFRNEMQSNSNASGDAAFHNLEDMYNFTTSLEDSIIAVLVIGIIYRVIWLIVLKLHTVLKKRSVMRRVDSARRGARKIVTAGLRWRRNHESDMYDADVAMGELEFGAPALA